jgi:hypothetical protein
MMWACCCLCLNLLYCCFSNEMSTVSLSLSTFGWEGPLNRPLQPSEASKVLLDLNMASTPKVAVTAMFSSSSLRLSSSSVYKMRIPLLANAMPCDQGVMLLVYFSLSSGTSVKGKGDMSTNDYKTRVFTVIMVRLYSNK